MLLYHHPNAELCSVRALYPVDLCKLDNPESKQADVENLTCLYAYNSREREVSALDIAFHRSTSVILGVIWAAVVSRYWWPFTARRELRMGISERVILPIELIAASASI